MAETEATNEWTVMFYFAGDNTLSPSMISQLKAIKDAGFQENTTVLAFFDPNEAGAPTRIFEVNRMRKLRCKTRIGDGRDPFVRNLREDTITVAELKQARGNGARQLGAEAERFDITKADVALESFLDFSHRNHPAKHYMLFLVGHGMIVGNDAFLPDDNPASGITLQRLGEILKKFAYRVKHVDKSAFELVGMHSCSLSAIEVAYQLKGTANYMMATEGVSFVGGWPYRQILKKIFKTVADADKNKLSDLEIKRLLMTLHFLCLHNITDFMFAGFSHDLCLCNLNPRRFKELEKPLKELTRTLKKTLEVSCGKQLILLAHCKAQSFWQENYSDLFDLCLCLSQACEDKNNLCRCANKECDERGTLQQELKAACDAVIKKLRTQDPKEADEKKRLEQAFDNLIVFSDHFGPTYQYAHGLSIYFPWSRPIEDGPVKVIGNYRSYAFTNEFDEDSWLSFLEQYFDKTQRPSRAAEDGETEEQPEGFLNTVAVRDVSRIIAADGISAIGALANRMEGKTTPTESGGSACSCASIKNYSRSFSASEGVKDAWRPRRRRRSSCW